MFAVLTHWSACNPGQPWWRKREIVTDICYWFLIPLAARFVRIGLMVMGAAYFYDIHGADALIKFYDDGFGPLGENAAMGAGTDLPGGVGFPDCTGFHRGSIMAAACGNTMPCIIPRKNSTGFRRRVSTPSTSCFGTVLVDAGLLLAGISPNVMLWVGPFTTATLGFRACQSELDARPV